MLRFRCCAAMFAQVFPSGIPSVFCSACRTNFSRSELCGDLFSMTNFVEKLKEVEEGLEGFRGFSLFRKFRKVEVEVCLFSKPSKLFLNLSKPVLSSAPRGRAIVCRHGRTASGRCFRRCPVQWRFQGIRSLPCSAG